ncbi:hypothetical protein BD410DRAFT_792982 [Rickenella mellea]|uniref:Uncharacterized protein n=1 Tax=Rickenella mellea TaxID=50990 RepID=A0A4Y7PTP8_9AGAM|nr:hypothetical protein BD410DRAFT_792982 [Rickenella mellea]
MVSQQHNAAMVFRLPTHLESFLPAPNEQPMSPSRPWRGTIALHGVNAFERTNGHQQLYVTAAETEGENRMEAWPTNLAMYFSRRSCRLSDLQEWVRRHKPPLCMFMPDRLTDSSASKANESKFRTLAKLMMDSHAVALIPWNSPGRLSGSGIIVFPTSTATGLLVGAVFLNSPFPDFVVSPSPNFASTTSSSQSFAQIAPSYSSRSSYPPSSHRQYNSQSPPDNFPHSPDYPSSANSAYPWP